MAITGRIHSIDSLGAVDGPGLRTVVFLQGCPLRCAYCHNPDTWTFAGGQETTAEDLMVKVKRYQAFSRFAGGGLTVSGGEPMAQAAFVEELFRRAGEAGIHRALDTSGTLDAKAAGDVLSQTDLLILDVKSTDAERYENITKVSSARFDLMMNEASKRNVPTWLRLVVVPGMTDGQDEIEGLRRLRARYPNIQKIELLPFHKMGEHKWEELGIAYSLGETPAMDPELAAEMQREAMEERSHIG